MRAAGAVLAVVAAVIWAAPAEAAPAERMPAERMPAETVPPGTVTLISGDRLLVAPDGRSASRLPTPGRDGIALISQFSGGHLRVVPADAVPLLADDRLDPRLFDVTALRESGYATHTDLPLIVTSDNPAVVTAAIGGPARDLATINSAAVRVTWSATASVWHALTVGSLRSAFRKVWLDGVAKLGVDVSVPLVGAPAAWAAGYTGRDVAVGVLDTGVDAGHPDLAGAVAESADFTASGDGVDRVGHGTHVASILAGSGAASDGRYRGMAPDVRLYSAKVCESEVCAESAVLAGMQWAARDKGVKVVNLSLGHADEQGTDLLEEAVGTLTARYGTLFVVAAGNDHGRLWSPASADAALAVGASDEADAVAGFSNRPADVVAPGVAITAARSGRSPLPGTVYTTLSGTSAAAPHVAGAAAILAQQHPDWTPEQLRSALTSSATPLDRAGAGRLDVANAVSSPVLASTANLTFDRPGTRTVTYRNSSAAPITLALSPGAPAPAFSLDQSTVTVPARSEATVRVSAGTAGPARSSVLTAASGDLAIHTMLDQVPAAYALTVRFIDRSGAVTTRAFAAAYDPSGTAWTGSTLRLPAGTYTLDAKIFEAGGGITVLNQPRVVVDRDTAVWMDARLGRPVTVTAPGSQVYAQVAVSLPGGAATAVQDDTFTGLATAQIGAGRPGLRTEVAAAFAAPGALYSLAWPVADRFVTGFARAAGASGLSVTHARFGGSGGALMTRLSAGGGYTSAFALPHRRTEYLTPGPWRSVFTADERPMTSATLGTVDAWNTGLYGPAFPAGSDHAVTEAKADPAWSADATHGGPPPGPATVTGNRISVGGTTWTVPAGRTGLLPLSAVRFEPRSATELGFFTQHQVAGTTTRSFDLEVSYDGGTSWRRALHARVGERGVAFVRPGRNAVSLRVTAVNSAGSTVIQTMIGAYRH
ncbi:MAG TPA: S8 family serine peptidase [Actinoplanes sp.]|nr:S8 family serine peptidase [Actinoplanes sp.]